MSLKEIRCAGCGLDLCDPGYYTVSGCCENCDEPLVSTKHGHLTEPFHIIRLPAVLMKITFVVSVFTHICETVRTVGPSLLSLVLISNPCHVSASSAVLALLCYRIPLFSSHSYRSVSLMSLIVIVSIM